VILSDKEIVDGLVGMCEMLFVQNILLKGLVRKAGVADWRDKMGKQANSVVASLAHEAFQKQYAQAVRDHQAFRKFLEDLPGSDSVQ
jgi:hypothetical protein